VVEKNRKQTYIIKKKKAKKMKEEFVEEKMKVTEATDRTAEISNLMLEKQRSLHARECSRK
jgi:hypothetical protein